MTTWQFIAIVTMWLSGFFAGMGYCRRADKMHEQARGDSHD